MSTTPLWVPILIAGIGLVGTVGGTLGGVLLTQQQSDRRDALAWSRQQDREQALWEREDAARTFEHRRQAYGDFYESLKEMARRAYDHGLGLADDDGEELPEGWQTETFRLLQRLDLYATSTVLIGAGMTYSAVWRWGHQTKYGQADDDFYRGQAEAERCESLLLVAIRTDLAIPMTEHSEKGNSQNRS
ncbi:hypothetical protein ACT8ZV_12910 [Nocardioides sp. MAHUQ-72]|uniref:hypothetical protein n=1 Tax=unclassified Nocardioides TaxID=2615069 RepID=UPI00360AD17C